MGIQDYVIQNYIFLVVSTGILAVSIHDVYLNRTTILILRTILAVVFILSIVDYVETWTSSLDHPTQVRVLLSVIGYTLRPTAIMLAIFMIHHRVRLVLLIPAIVNALIYSTAFFSDITFSYDETNSFHRQPLGYSFVVVSLFYVVILCYNLVRSFRSRHGYEWILVIYFLSVAVLTVILTFFFDVDGLFNLTFISSILLYYLEIYIQHTKLDTLTGLYNRQVFYTDMKKYHSSITGIISIDMNDLKVLNDTEGHESGDKALKTISECFLKCVNAKSWVYRVGGDEFVIFCTRQTEKEMQQLTENLRAAVDETDYSCCFGLATGGDPAEMLRESDRIMYDEKARFKVGRDYN